jgi:hypothetical protein
LNGWIIVMNKVIAILWLITALSFAKSELVPDYRNGKPNALVCPDNGKCFQCDHATAKLLAANRYWDGAIVFLPLNKKP